MDRFELAKDVTHVIEKAATLQWRLLSWTVETEDDKDAVRRDLEDIIETADYIRLKVGRNGN